MIKLKVDRKPLLDNVQKCAKINDNKYSPECLQKPLTFKNMTPEHLMQ